MARSGEIGVRPQPLRNAVLPGHEEQGDQPKPEPGVEVRVGVHVEHVFVPHWASKSKIGVLPQIEIDRIVDAEHR